MNHVKVIVCSLFVFLLFILNFPTVTFGPSFSNVFIFTPNSNLHYSSLIHYRIICSDHFLNGNVSLNMVGKEFIFSKKISLLSPVENIYQDISKFPAGEYQSFLSKEGDQSIKISNSWLVSVNANPPFLKMKDWPQNGIKKITMRNTLIEVLASEKLRQVYMNIDDQLIRMEDYGLIWKWNGFIPVKNGINNLVLIGTNYHDVSSRQIFQIELEEKREATKIPVLVYHNIGYMNGSFNVTPDIFETQLKQLIEQGCYFINSDELSLFLQNKITLPEKAVLITFDDGYEGVFQYALPLLKMYQIKATLFVVTSYIGNTSFLSWDQLDDIVDSKLFTIGSHTNDLHYYQKLTAFLINCPALLRFRLIKETEKDYQSRIINDLYKSRKLLKDRYHIEISYFAYPFGAYNNEAKSMIQKAGFTNAYAYDSQIRKLVTRNSDGFLLERFPVFQYSTNMDLFMEEQ